MISGQLALTLKILALPSALIGTSVAQVYFQKLAVAKNDGISFADIVQPAFIGLLGIGICFCLAVILLAPPLFPIIFGSDWAISGQYAKILAPALALRFIISPLSSAFAALNRIELAAIWRVVAAIVTTVSLFVSSYYNNPITSLMFLTISDIIIYSLYLYWIFKISNSSLKGSFLYLFNRIK